VYSEEPSHMKTTPDIQFIQESITLKMQQAGIATSRIETYLASVAKVATGNSGFIPEDSIAPARDLIRLEDLENASQQNTERLHQLVCIKLNGGLGTGMGLDRAKSLMQVKGEETFLDFIARQALELREKSKSDRPAFYLMNSFSTRRDTLHYLEKFPDLSNGDQKLDFLQGMAPKLDAETLEPVTHESNPDLEWCPPGHGDLYASLMAEGLLESLLERGIIYAFVSNSDNLGATIHPGLLAHFAESGNAFMMEVARRTTSDRKGGHLAQRKSDGHLILRESAQCTENDLASFQDIDQHRYFNTNNLWIRLDRLKEALDQQEGVFQLPLIQNKKTVDPKDPDSQKVLQLESAMGAAIACFDQTCAIEVDRTRFSPVKTTSDLLALRSDAYTITANHCLVLDATRAGIPPLVKLDPSHYKTIQDFNKRFGRAVPSLVDCDSLTVSGPLTFEEGVILRGHVHFQNDSGKEQLVPTGVYENVERTWE
jgi:UDP-N-acetylglucosamine pyrophosphorylase